MVRGMRCLTAIVLLVTLIIFGCAPKNPKLAIVGNTAITLEDLKSELTTGDKPASMENISYTTAKSKLDGLVSEELIYQGALAQEFENKPNNVTALKRRHDPLLRNRLYEKMVVEKIIKESELRDFYNHMLKQVVCRNIFFKFPEMASPQQVDSIKVRAQSVYKMLKEGADFSEMAKQYSDDRLTGPKGGFIGKLFYSRSDDPLLNAAFLLHQGEFSEPVKNRMGYHIIKVDEIIRTGDLPPYEVVRPQIIADLKRARKRVLDQAAREYQLQLRDKYQLTYNDSLIQSLAAIIGSIGQTPVKILAGMRTLSPDTLEMALASLSFKKFTVSGFMQRLEAFSPYGRMAVTSAEELKPYIDNWILPDMLLQSARDAGLDKDKEFLTTYGKAKKHYLVTAFTDSVIIGSLDFSNDEIRSFYESHKKDLYTVPETRKVRELYTKDQAKLSSLRKQIVNGASFAPIAEKYTERKGYKKRKGLLGYIKETNWGAIGKHAFQMKQGVVSEPIQLAKPAGYSLIVVEDIAPPHPLDFDTNKSKIVTDMKNQITQERKDSWLKKRRAELNVRINEEALEDAFPKAPSL